MPRQTMQTGLAVDSPVVRAVVEEVRAFCQSHADPERAQKYSRYFTEGYDAYGVDHRDPAWEENRRRWGGMLREAGPLAFLDAGDVLVRTGKYEEASFAILLVMDSRDVYSPEVFQRLGGWFEGGIRNWGHTDVLAGDVLSRFLVDGIVGLNALESWRDSKWKFQRRAVPVMLIKLLDYPLDLGAVLTFLEPLMRDPEKVVQQAMGWFLRELWKRSPEVAEDFLIRFRDIAPRLIFQYATEKMTAEGKARFRRRK